MFKTRWLSNFNKVSTGNPVSTVTQFLNLFCLAKSDLFRSQCETLVTQVLLGVIHAKQD